MGLKLFSYRIIACLLCSLYVLCSSVVCAQTDTLPEIENAPKPVKIKFDANVICQGDSVVLNVDFSNYGIVSQPICEWNYNPLNTSLNQVVHTSLDTTLVWVKLYDNNAFIGDDTVYLFTTTLPINYEVIDDTICLGDQATVGVTSGNYWNWSTFGTTQYINDRPLRTTKYDVNFSYYPISEIGFINRCFIKDSAFVIVLEEPSYLLVADTLVCRGSNTSARVENGSNILWHNGSTETSILIEDFQKDSTIRVVATDRFGCRGAKSVKMRITEGPDGEIFFHNLLDTVCLGDELSIGVNTTIADSIRWFNGSNEETITILPKQSIIVYCDLFKNESCSIRLYKALTVKNCANFYFPSGFKLEGISKTYAPIGNILPEWNYYFAIFSRNGKLIFETTDLSRGWDGRYKGQFVKPDVYVYYFKSTWDRFKDERNGTITVVK